jgi:hypothetical protein
MDVSKYLKNSGLTNYSESSWQLNIEVVFFLSLAGPRTMFEDIRQPVGTID